MIIQVYHLILPFSERECHSWNDLQGDTYLLKREAQHDLAQKIYKMQNSLLLPPAPRDSSCQDNRQIYGCPYLPFAVTHVEFLEENVSSSRSRSFLLNFVSHLFSVVQCWLVAGLYMIGYRKGNIILKFPPFFRLNEENQEREIQNQMKTKTKTFLFLFSFDVLNFPALDFPRSI